MPRMITFDDNGIRFTNRIIGVAFDRSRVLLHRTDDMDFWALPGGRAELMEASPDTLVREMREEIDTDVTVDRLLWLAENFFQFDGRAHHELGLYYLMHLPADSPLRDTTIFLGHEGAMSVHFEWFPVDALENVPLFPSFLRTGLKVLPEHTVHIVHIDPPEESARP
jgi:ADP-ribose pyrophosphatase YjhB (NUDIX family)